MAKKVIRTRCNNEWTEARFKSFIKSQLRGASRKWAPINTTKKKAWESRGQYKCAHCNELHAPTVKVGNKRSSNIFVDHIKPIIDPQTGFTNWDDYIEGLFCEEDNLQLLCKKCHDIKSNNERDKRYGRN